MKAAAILILAALLTGCDSAGNPDWQTIGTVTRAATGAMAHERQQEDYREDGYERPAYYPPPQPMVNPYNGQVFYPYGPQ